MKKTLCLCAILLALAFLLTGCVDVNYEVALHEDGTADITYIYGFEKAVLEQLGTTADDMTSDMEEQVEDSDYTVEPYSDDEIEGFKATKHVEDFSEISLEDAFGADYVTDTEENQIHYKKNLLVTVYSQEASIDLTSMDSSDASYVTLKYIIDLPVESRENNANKVSEDGLTLTWTLEAGEVNNISFEAVDVHDEVIVGAIILVLIIIVLISNLRKKKQQQN